MRLSRTIARKSLLANSLCRLASIVAVVGAVLVSSSVFFSGRTSSIGANATSAARARLSDSVSTRGAGRGNPWINMTDGHELLTAYEGPNELVRALARDEARPLSLISADFDEDGMPDLVAGYAGANGGIITINRGNVDSVYPNTQAGRRRKSEGTFSDVPFLSPARIFEATVPPDFIEAGDFDGDGHKDLVIGSRGENSVYLMPGDGGGGFKSPVAMVLPGKVTAMASGDVNRADGLVDLVVAVGEIQSPELLVFEGLLTSKPEAFDLPSEATAITIGYLSDATEADIAVAAGQELLIVHGRDRKLFLDEKESADVPEAQITRRTFSSKLTSLAIGDFIGDLTLDLGVASEDGTVQVVSERQTQDSTTQPGNKHFDLAIETLASNLGVSRGKLIAARLSSLSHETLMMTDQNAHTLNVWMDDAERRQRNDVTLSAVPGEREKPVTLDVDDGPVAVLPMRLNIDGISDLVVLRSGHVSPLVIQSQPTQTFTVFSAADSGPGTLRAAITSANGSPGSVIAFSLPGSGVPTITLSSALPTITVSLTVDGTTQGQVGPGQAPQALGNALVELNGSNVVTDGMRVSGANCVTRGLVINRCGNGIRVSNTSGNIIEGNLIGTTTTGNNISQNSNRGVLIDNSARNTIGNPQATNVISGNSLGLEINGANANDNVIRFNNIGANSNATQSLGNRGNGVRITNGASRNRIGAIVASGFDNAIYGSQGDGVAILSGNANLVQANLFQLNQGDGVNVGSSNNIVGGAGRPLANFIWSSTNNGVEINGVATTNNLVQGNRIGVDFDTNGIPLNRQNTVHGVAITNSSSGNFIGGATDVNLANFIAFNTGDGVSVLSGTGNRILINSIFSNLGSGIDLGNDGRDVNDDKDLDSGANGKQNYPVLVSAVLSASSALAIESVTSLVTIRVMFNSTPNQSFDILFYSCSNSCSASGDQFSGCIPQSLGTRTVTTLADGNFSQDFQFDLGAGVSSGFVNATATNRTNGDTSEFSSCVQIGSCSFAITPQTASVGAAAGTGSFTVTAAAGCAWTATSNAAFLTTSSTGNGNGPVTYSFQQNTSGAERTGTITVGNATHTVTQVFQVAPDFALSFEQSPVTGLNGTKARITVIINRTGGFTGDVTVTPPPKQNGVKAKPPDPIATTTAEPTASFKLKIAFGLEPGSRQLTFTGTDASGRIRTATATLIVQ
jgi:hypothetical protein